MATLSELVRSHVGLCADTAVLQVAGMVFWCGHLEWCLWRLKDPRAGGVRMLA